MLIAFQPILPFMLVLHLTLTLIALTPICEGFMRTLCGANEIVTEADKNYLEPLFEEVYSEAMCKYPSISKKIKLYKSKEVMPNAYALGSNTIVLTKGAIETFSSDELKGVIAHELGHIAHGDTKMTLVIFANNIIVWSILLIVNALLSMTANISRMFGDNAVGYKVMIWIKKVVLFLLTQIVLVIIAFGSRGSEYLADEFAYNIGYGIELIKVLTTLSRMDFKKETSILSVLKESHPDLEYRIARLEQMQY